nr:hypothetical protein 26 [bacterium]
MNQVEKYIQNELDIARYRVQMFKKLGKLTPAKRRLLEIEQEFIEIPLDSMGFKSVEEVSRAIRLYRTARFKFYEEYQCLSLSEVVKKLDSKFQFVLDIRDEFLGNRVEEINVIQNPYFFKKLVEYEKQRGGISEKEIKNSDISRLVKIEPAVLSKERARVQAILYSVGLYLDDTVGSESFPGDTLKSAYDSLRRIEFIIADLKNNLFEHYNRALDALPQKLQGTMGENHQLSRVHRLHNLASDASVGGSPLFKGAGFDCSKLQLGYLLFGIKPAIYQTVAKDRDRQTRNRVYGILLPRERTGNEKLSLLHKKIVYNGADITDIFSDNLSNIKAINKDGEISYFKALMVKPLWEVIYDDIAPKSYEAMSDVTGYKFSDILEHLDCRGVSTKINSTCTNFLDLSRDESIILVAKTRAEEEHLQRAVEIASGRINDVYAAATND